MMNLVNIQVIVQRLYIGQENCCSFKYHFERVKAGPENVRE